MQYLLHSLNISHQSAGRPRVWPCSHWNQEKNFFYISRLESIHLLVNSPRKPYSLSDPNIQYWFKYGIMLVWDLCLYVSNYHGKRTCTFIVTFGCLLLSLSSCSRSAWFMPAFPGESILFSQILTLDLFKGIQVSVVHSFKSMLLDLELNSGCCTVCSFFHCSHCQSSGWFQRKC